MCKFSSTSVIVGSNHGGRLFDIEISQVIIIRAQLFRVAGDGFLRDGGLRCFRSPYACSRRFEGVAKNIRVVRHTSNVHVSDLPSPRQHLNTMSSSLHLCPSSPSSSSSYIASVDLIMLSIDKFCIPASMSQTLYNLTITTAYTLSTITGIAGYSRSRPYF